MRHTFPTWTLVLGPEDIHSWAGGGEPSVIFGADDVHSNADTGQRSPGASEGGDRAWHLPASQAAALTFQHLSDQMPSDNLENLHAAGGFESDLWRQCHRDRSAEDGWGNLD